MEGEVKSGGGGLLLIEIAGVESMVGWLPPPAPIDAWVLSAYIVCMVLWDDVDGRVCLLARHVTRVIVK